MNLPVVRRQLGAAAIPWLSAAAIDRGRLQRASQQAVTEFPRWRAGDYEDQALRLAAGDLLLVYSDGLTDHRLSATERVGRQRVVNMMARGVEMPCEDLVRSIVMETVGDGVPSDDDVPVLALRYRGGARPSWGAGESADLALQA